MTSTKSNPSTELQPTYNDLAKDLRKEMIELLSPRLADTIDLHWQAKQAHWNCKGPNFFGLHQLFDKVAEEADEWADLIAERMVQLGGVTHGTIRMASKDSSLPEYTLGADEATKHSDALASHLAQYGKAVRKGIQTSSDAGDQDTADLLTEVSRAVDKLVWFLEAHAWK